MPTRHKCVKIEKLQILKKNKNNKMETQIVKKQKTEEKPMVHFPPLGFDHVYICPMSEYQIEWMTFNAGASKHGAKIVELLKNFNDNVLTNEQQGNLSGIFYILQKTKTKPSVEHLKDGWFRGYKCSGKVNEDSDDDDEPFLPNFIQELLDLDDYGIWGEPSKYGFSTAGSTTRPVFISFFNRAEG